jgi:hypothetical protein
VTAVFVSKKKITQTGELFKFFLLSTFVNIKYFFFFIKKMAKEKKEETDKTKKSKKPAGK